MTEDSTSPVLRRDTADETQVARRPSLLEAARRHFSAALSAKVAGALAGVLVTWAAIALAGGRAMVLAHPDWAAILFLAIAAVTGLVGLLVARHHLTQIRARWSYRPHLGVWWRVDVRSGFVEECRIAPALTRKDY